MKDNNYHDNLNKENTFKLRELMRQLPKFTASFFRGIEPTTASRTRIAYAYDLGIFFEYIKENNPLYADKEITDFPLEILDQITSLDIEDQYADTEEIYEALVTYIIDYLEDNTEFGKKMIKYMILGDKITGRQVCQLLIDKEIVHLTDEVIQDFSENYIVTWTPKESGEYYLYVDIKNNATDKIESKWIYYEVK